MVPSLWQRRVLVLALAAVGLLCGMAFRRVLDVAPAPRTVSGEQAHAETKVPSPARSPRVVRHLRTVSHGPSDPDPGASEHLAETVVPTKNTRHASKIVTRRIPRSALIGRLESHPFWKGGEK
jgi:hypothetical protein